MNIHGEVCRYQLGKNTCTYYSSEQAVEYGSR